MNTLLPDQAIQRMEEIGVDFQDLDEEAWRLFLHHGWQLRVRWCDGGSEKRIRLTGPTGENYFFKKREPRAT